VIIQDTNMNGIMRRAVVRALAGVAAVGAIEFRYGLASFRASRTVDERSRLPVKD
jgi:hypothetical protein